MTCHNVPVLVWPTQCVSIARDCIKRKMNRMWIMERVGSYFRDKLYHIYLKLILYAANRTPIEKYSSKFRLHPLGGNSCLLLIGYGTLKHNVTA